MEAEKFIARFLEINVLALITFCLNTVELQQGESDRIILALYSYCGYF